METQYNDQKVRVIYLKALEKTKKLKIKIANLECKYLEEAIVVMNLVSAFKAKTSKYEYNYEAKKKPVEHRQYELYELEVEIDKLRNELDENNNLLMRSCIESEELITNCLNDDWEKVKSGFEEFQILTKAIRKIEGVS